MCIVVFDGTIYFVESADYDLEHNEEVAFVGTFDKCCDVADKLNSGSGQATAL